ncbi:MAG: polysaccharide deacetylase family protein [Eubacteriales bacterium]|nr:polysaccharide deacetylase family protein [Eubacteriales bacterium]
MPYRNERYRRRKQKRTAIIGIVVAALLIEIVVVIVLLSRDCSGRRSTPDLTSQQTAPAATETPVPEDTSVPAETPMSVPTPSPAPAKQSHAVNGYLPIYEKVDTSEKVIAVTVDDLLQPTNLKKICQLAKDYNAKLTLFPIGKMLEREDIRSTVKRAYEELGFEIENHTYGHNRLYMEDEAGLANAVCKQQMLVNDTLGVKLSDAFSAHAGRQWGKGSSLSSISGSARLLGNRELVLQRQQCRHLCH